MAGKTALPGYPLIQGNNKMALDFVIKTTGSKPNFESEFFLEEFCRQNFTALFGSTILNRQFYIDEQYTDLLALGENNQLIIVELKAKEDRYVVQQLTRYYDAIVNKKPFADQVDYGLPIRLIALAPQFHRDNFTDLKYHKLDIEFFSYEIKTAGETFLFSLKNLAAQTSVDLPIATARPDFLLDPVAITVPSPPKLLLKAINELINPEKGDQLLLIRQKILSFHPKMQEIEERNQWTYAKSKSSKPCATILRSGQRPQKRVGTNTISLLLNLPDISSNLLDYKIVETWILSPDYKTFNCLINQGRNNMIYDASSFEKDMILDRLQEVRSKFIEIQDKNEDNGQDFDQALRKRQNLEKICADYEKAMSNWGSLDELVDLALAVWQRNL